MPEKKMGYDHSSPCPLLSGYLLQNLSLRKPGASPCSVTGLMPSTRAVPSLRLIRLTSSPPSSSLPFLPAPLLLQGCQPTKGDTNMLLFKGASPGLVASQWECEHGSSRVSPLLPWAVTLELPKEALREDIHGGGGRTVLSAPSEQAESQPMGTGKEGLGTLPWATSQALPLTRVAQRGDEKPPFSASWSLSVNNLPSTPGRAQVS